MPLDPADFTVPPLPADFRGRSAATLMRGTFAPLPGPEVFLLILETRAGARAITGPSTQLHCQGVLGATDHGALILLLWNIWDSTGRSTYEEYLDPLSREDVQSLHDLARQQSLPALLVDSDTGAALDGCRHPRAFIEALALDALVAGALSRAAVPTPDFARAVAQFRAENSVDAQLAASPTGELSIL
jgi:hypothetical protein